MKRITIFLLIVVGILCQLPVFAEYTDVAPTDKYYEDIMYCQEHRIMLGIGDNRFASNSLMTRGMAIQALYNQSGKSDAKYTNNYSDVDSNTWYTEAVNWGASVGVIDGYPDGTFHPMSPVTGEQFAAMIFRLDKLSGVDVTKYIKATVPTYITETVSPWAAEASTYVYNKGYITRNVELEFNPVEPLTRGDAAAILAKTYYQESTPEITIPTQPKPTPSHSSHHSPAPSPAPANPIVSITVTTPPSKTTYVHGDTFDATGMVITATYANGTHSIVTGYTVSPGTLTYGTTAVTISYGGVSATVPITVNRVVSGITVTTPPTTTVYSENSTFDATGMVVTATYTDGGSEAVTSYTVSSDPLLYGTTSVAVSYSGFSANVPVTVIHELKSIAVTTPPTKTVYNHGDAFDATGMVVTITYLNNDQEIVTGYTVTPNPVTYGTTSVTVSYGGKSTTTPITVNRVLDSITVTTPPDTTTYKHGDTFDTTGMVVTANYTDGGSEAITAYSVSPDPLTHDTSSVTVSCGGKSTTVPVTVNRIQLTAVPSQSGTLTYNGSAQSPTWSGYDSDKMSVIGSQSETSANTYSVTFTPGAEYMWPDGSTDGKVVTWTIDTKPLTIAAKAQTIDYGNAINAATVQVVPTGLVEGDTLDSIVLTPSTTNATAAGTIVPSAAHVVRGVTDTSANYSITYTDGVLTINKVSPIVTSAPSALDLIHTGSTQELVSAGAVSGGTIQYKLGDGEWSSTIPTATDVDTYEVYYKIVGDTNHTDLIVATPISVTIATAFDLDTMSLKFSSTDGPVTISAPKNWDGTLEYSTDGSVWSVWDGSEISSDTLYLRGTGNSVISNGSAWTITGTAVSCSGNIENLLDYTTVAAGDYPTMGTACYRQMFKGCTSITSAPELPATTLTESCYEDMFMSCTSLTTVPELPATTLAKKCYAGMFICTSLTSAPELPATTLAPYCYLKMFAGCASLTSSPALPATTLVNNCYDQMFYSCTSLTSAPELPATTLTENCYAGMFRDCAYLTSAPVLPATTLAYGCYGSMFQDCTSLTSAPALPATTLDLYCYSSMFSGCISLASAPALPAATLAEACYSNMFSGCAALASAPALPATTLAKSCYSNMFLYCTSLTSAPELPATTLAKSCYSEMFYGCTSIKVSETQTSEYTIPYRIPTTDTGTTATDALKDMFKKTGGTFTETPHINVTYYLYSPSSSTSTTQALKFSSPDGPITIYAYNFWDGILEYSTDGSSWSVWDGSEVGGTNTIYFRGTGNSVITGDVDARWTITGTSVSCTGNIENLLDYNTVAAGNHPEMGYECYAGMFGDCYNLISAPELPATTLAEGCYDNMFRCCTALTSAPELPATTLTDHCYESMFSDCTGLISAPALPATIATYCCYEDMFNGCTSLTSAPELPATTLADNCYLRMFKGCTSLTSAPELPATILATSCYCYMFDGCTSLTSAPELPATTLDVWCYEGMFEGCTSLTSAPELTATMLVESCYNSMFSGCTSLTTAPELPATTLAEKCYYGMFDGCTGLTSTPALHATNLANWCYSSMFSGCTSLTTPPELPATTLANWCYSSMFSGCTSLKLSETQTEEYTIPYRIPTTDTGTEASNALKDMFTGTGGTFTETPSINTTYYLYSPSSGAPSTSFDLDTMALKFSSPDGPVTISATKNWDSTLEYSTDGSSWDEWDGSEISSNTLYFRGTGNSVISNSSPWTITGTSVSCSGNIENLLDYETVVAGNHPTMDVNCYAGMFYGCTALISTPELPATTLRNSCYKDMFRGCTSLTTAPALPATTLANVCYYDMFYGCTSLTTAPALPATTLYRYCYSHMFDGCMALASAPALPATTLAESCYEDMFKGCTSLTTAPALPATTLANYCYKNMFQGCTSLKISATQTDEYTIPYRIPTTGIGITAYESLVYMFSDTGGTFTDTPNINTTYYLYSPSSGTSFDPDTMALKFSSPDGPIAISAPKNWNGTLEYSTDGEVWSTWDGTSIGGTNTIYFRGTGNSVITGDGYDTWTITGTSVSCTGNIENLLDYATVADGNHPMMAENCYFCMFSGCTSLISAPELPATTLVTYCYAGMFMNCNSLISAPELPAATLADYCYNAMFYGCTSLTSAPELQATSLADYCYSNMFNGCTSLVSVPELPATTLAEACYSHMFESCISLTSTPTLPATNLASYCYKQMFDGCTSITAAPSLPATTLVSYCYANIFSGCTSLKISETQTSEYTIPYRIPVTGAGTIADYSHALEDMFKDTGGTFTGTPNINTTYYLHSSNSIVPATP